MTAQHPTEEKPVLGPFGFKPSRASDRSTGADLRIVTLREPRELRCPSTLVQSWPGLEFANAQVGMDPSSPELVLRGSKKSACPSPRLPVVDSTSNSEVFRGCPQRSFLGAGSPRTHRTLRDGTHPNKRHCFGLSKTVCRRRVPLREVSPSNDHPQGRRTDAGSTAATDTRRVPGMVAGNRQPQRLLPDWSDRPV